MRAMFPARSISRARSDRSSECVEVVRCDDLGDLVRVDARVRREVAGSGEVLRLPIPPRQRLVGDALDERLQEPVLAALGREGVRVEVEELLADEVVEKRP